MKALDKKTALSSKKVARWREIHRSYRQVVTQLSAQDPNIGTWKLNEAKSKISPGAPMNKTVAYDAGVNARVTIDGGTGFSGIALEIDGESVF
jgi:hypothetical protein